MISSFQRQSLLSISAYCSLYCNNVVPRGYEHSCSEQIFLKTKNFKERRANQQDYSKDLKFQYFIILEHY